MTEDGVVTLKDGKIKGIKEKSPFFNAEFYSFYGVPYGQPAIGDLRFRDPEKVKPWKCIRDASVRKEGCYQYSLVNLRLMGSEDCLYVNVHTPQLPQKGEPLKAVVAFIHLGGGQWGSPDPSHHGSPEFVMHRDIVYVTIGYRLHILGFLNLELPECSGNQVLKDIMLAFRWIRENIQQFNGDPSNVTALGTSSGATIVHALMISPVARGLFDKAVLMGEYVLNCLVPYRDDHLQLAFHYGRLLGFKRKSPKELLHFLKKLPIDKLFGPMKFFRDKYYEDICLSFQGGIFMITIDKTIWPESPRQLINSAARIPIIFGICEREAALGFTRPFTVTKQHLRQNIHGWIHYLNDDQLERLYEQIESFYFKNRDQSVVPLDVKIDFLTDAAYSDVYRALIDVLSADLPSSVYVYKFRYVSEIGDLRNKIAHLLPEPVDGTYHSDDVCFWAHVNTPTSTKTIKVIDTFTKLITNFAKTSDPTHEGIETQWRPTTPENSCYLDIDSELTMIDGKLNNERLEFWDNLKKQLQPMNF